MKGYRGRSNPRTTMTATRTIATTAIQPRHVSASATTVSMMPFRVTFPDRARLPRGRL